MERLLEVNDLTVRYTTDSGVVTALDNVNLHVGKDELLAVVGESGCGKSTLGLSIMGLLSPRSSSVAGGSIDYKGADIVKMDQNQMRKYRGNEIAMIFQEPLTSLNPVYRVGDQIAEALVLGRMRKEQGKDATGRGTKEVYRSDAHYFSRLPRPRGRISKSLSEDIVEWMRLVRIADPDQVLNRYPFELSGGMRQRVMIAMALCQEPALLIADEPTTALDVTTQAQVLKLMRDLMDKVRTSILLITHDLAVASQVADRVAVMYAGEIVEDAEVHQLFSKPLHPYTKGLLSCIPNGTKDDSNLKPIPGSLPDLRQAKPGCCFAPRCPFAFDRCASERPRLIRSEQSHEVSCFLYDK